MADERPQRRLAAILAADVVGYSRLMEADEAGTLARLRALRAELFAPTTAAHGGRIFKTTGDGALVEFASAVGAVESAIEIQRALAQRDTELPEDRRIALRIGISLGDVIVEGADLYGNGVNVAARLEAMAEPGGISVSGNVHDSVGRSIDVAYDDLGEQPVKNIERPVHAWRVVLGEAAHTTISPGPAADDRPSIAVLPFENLSSDAAQDYFADGITEDLITGLSRIRTFFVIARNSTLAYKGAAPDVRRVASDLGVRYVIEGSVRVAGERVRVTVQLIDGRTGNHIWAERYDRPLADIFELQDEITRSIVGQLEPELGRAEYERTKSLPPENLDAWALYHRAWLLSASGAGSGAQLAEARALFEQAIERDPGFARAYAGLALNDARSFPVDRSAAEREQALGWARRAVELDPKDSFAHLALGAILQIVFDDNAAALRAFETAHRLNPNNAQVYFGLGLTLRYVGRLEEALSHLAMAIRLSPFDPVVNNFHSVKGGTHFQLGQYEDAAECAAMAVRGGYRHLRPYAVLIASLGHLGRTEEATRVRRDLDAVEPGFSIGFVRANATEFRNPEIDRLIEGLRRAGVPE